MNGDLRLVYVAKLKDLHESALCMFVSVRACTEISKAANKAENVSLLSVCMCV